MPTSAIGRRRLLLIALALPLLAAAGCRSEMDEADAARARATVERALRAPTFEAFVAAFASSNRARMVEVPIWIRWWQEKFEKDRAGWQVTEVRGLRDGRIEVVAQHRRRTTSRQFYRLHREGGAWLIDDIQSER